jgi:hypothetical protein
MSTYEVTLILEALAKVYSCHELASGLPVIRSLVKHLKLDPEQAEAVVEGALQLKQARAHMRELSPCEIYVQ